MNFNNHKVAHNLCVSQHYIAVFSDFFGIGIFTLSFCSHTNHNQQ